MSKYMYYAGIKGNVCVVSAAAVSIFYIYSTQK